MEKKPRMTKEEKEARKLERNREKLEKLEEQREVLEQKLEDTKELTKELKMSLRQNKKDINKLKPEKKKNSGSINSTVEVSDEFASFFETEKTFHRPQIMKYIKNSIEKHDIKTVGKIRLLEVPGFLELLSEEEQERYNSNPEDYSLTWTNIQKKLSHHIKTVKNDNCTSVPKNSREESEVVEVEPELVPEEPEVVPEEPPKKKSKRKVTEEEPPKKKSKRKVLETVPEEPEVVTEEPEVVTEELPKKKKKSKEVKPKLVKKI